MSVIVHETASVACDLCGERKALDAATYGERTQCRMTGRQIEWGAPSRKHDAVSAGYRVWSLETWDPTEYGSRGGHACPKCWKVLNDTINRLSDKKATP